MPRPSNGLGVAESKTIRARVPTDAVEAWEAFVERHSPETASSLLRLLITEFVKRDEEAQDAAAGVVDYLIAASQRVPKPAIEQARRMKQAAQEEKGRGKRFEVKLKATEAAGVEAMAEAAGVSANHWLVSYVRAGLTGTLLKPHPDMMALLGMRAELAPIGRNLNQLVKRINADPELAKSITARDFEKLSGAIVPALASLKKATDVSFERGRLFFDAASGAGR